MIMNQINNICSSQQWLNLHLANIEKNLQSVKMRFKEHTETPCLI